MRAREIEELYGEIMKTVNSNHMDFTECKENGLLNLFQFFLFSCKF